MEVTAEDIVGVELVGFITGYVQQSSGLWFFASFPMFAFASVAYTTAEATHSRLRWWVLETGQGGKLATVVVVVKGFPCISLSIDEAVPPLLLAFIPLLFAALQWLLRVKTIALI